MNSKLLETHKSLQLVSHGFVYFLFHETLMNNGQGSIILVPSLLLHYARERLEMRDAFFA